MGAAAATPDILSAIARLLQDEDADVRRAAAGAVRGMGAAAATPEFLSAITRLLQYEDWSVREAAVEAYRTMMQLGVRLFQKGREWEVKWVTELAETG
jgi:hypothetical protein